MLWNVLHIMLKLYIFCNLQFHFLFPSVSLHIQYKYWYIKQVIGKAARQYSKDIQTFTFFYFQSRENFTFRAAISGEKQALAQVSFQTEIHFKELHTFLWFQTMGSNTRAASKNQMLQRVTISQIPSQQMPKTSGAYMARQVIYIYIKKVKIISKLRKINPVQICEVSDFTSNFSF